MKGLTLKYNYNKFLKKVKSSLVKYSQNKEKNTQNFLNKVVFKDNVSGELVKVDYSLKNKYRVDSLYYLNVIQFLNQLTDKECLTPLFITLTSPSQLHIFKKRNDKIVLNENYENYKELCNYENNKDLLELKLFEELRNSVENSYKLLQFESREIIRNYQRTMKTHKNIYYFKMFEYHKSLIPHLHMLVFVKEEIKDKIIKLIEKRMKKNNIKQFDIKELTKENKENGSKYISKYITKTLVSDRIDDMYLLDGWKRKFNIRFFTHSRVGLPRYIFKKLIKYKDLLDVKNKDNFINYYKELTNNTTVFKFNNLTKSDFKQKEENILRNKNINSDFLVFVNSCSYQENDKELEERKNKIFFKLKHFILKHVNQIEDYEKRFFVFRDKINKVFFEEMDFLYENFLKNDFSYDNFFVYNNDFLTKSQYRKMNKTYKDKEQFYNNFVEYFKMLLETFYLKINTIYYLSDYRIYYNDNGKNKLIYDKNEISVYLHC